jgi:hypothetical protein
MPTGLQRQKSTSTSTGKDSAMNDEPHPVPITGELDLHTFRPSEIGELLPELILTPSGPESTAGLTAD